MSEKDQNRYVFNLEGDLRLPALIRDVPGWVPRFPFIVFRIPDDIFFTRRPFSSKLSKTYAYYLRSGRIRL